MEENIVELSEKDTIVGRVKGLQTVIMIIRSL